jgi:CDP-glucose 4,6-dehydratase
MVKKVAFVTGISGFVGAHLAAELIEENIEVVGLQHDLKKRSYLDLLGIRDRICLINGDIMDIDFLHRVMIDYTPDWVFHLAAVSIVGRAVEYPVYTYKTNVFGTLALLEACRLATETPEAILCVSSDKSYGNMEEASEEDPLKGEGIYDSSKVCMDVVSHAYYYDYDLPIVVTRACNIIGLDGLNSRIVPNTIKAMLSGKRPIIFKDADTSREYVHVDDVCCAYIELLKAISTTKGRAYNVGSKDGVITQEDLVLKIVEIGNELMNTNIKPEYVVHGTSGTKVFNEIVNQSLNSAKIYLDIGWLPKLSLEEGLRKTFLQFISEESKNE